MGLLYLFTSTTPQRNLEILLHHFSPLHRPINMHFKYNYRRTEYEITFFLYSAQEWLFIILKLSAERLLVYFSQTPEGQRD
jgi:hypothetical protein